MLDKGYTVLEKNYAFRRLEIDLIAKTGDILVFVEVKTRTSLRYGYPEAAITLAKRNHLLDAANYYLMEHPSLDGDWRIDVVAIRVRENSPPEIIHFENAVA